MNTVGNTDETTLAVPYKDNGYWVDEYVTHDSGLLENGDMVQISNCVYKAPTNYREVIGLALIHNTIFLSKLTDKAKNILKKLNIDSEMDEPSIMKQLGVKLVNLNEVTQEERDTFDKDGKLSKMILDSLDVDINDINEESFIKMVDKLTSKP